MPRAPKEQPVNTIALNIDRAERTFAQKLSDIAGISLADANRVSIEFRRRYLAWINDRATAIEPVDARCMQPAAIKAALKELNERG